MAAHLDMLRRAGDERALADGETVFVQGETGRVMYAVVEGAIEIVVHDHVIEVVEPGGVFGEMALIDHHERSATARSRGESSITMIDEKRFLFLVQNHPTFALEMMRVLASRLRHMDEIL
jgi:CRP-like cAMP-binding protein